ncbi:MAG: hypothetical protein HY026_10820 [Deltaproteobacteria bacterium]|nr:hypothetical protein [Deltaproteobacteria bacterium]
MLSEGNESFFDKAFMLTVLLVFLFLPLTVGAETSQAQSNTVPAANVAPGEQPLAVEVAEYAGKGDYNTGKALFTGEKTFVNGGPPCISCHNAGVGELGGGCLAPDLTKAYADPTKNALLSTAWVNGGGSPVMGPIFSNKKVTDEEMDHLRAFFKTCSEKPVRPASTGTFAIFGLGGSVGLLILFSLIWSGRYSKRNQDTAHDALWRNYGGKGGR